MGQDQSPNQQEPHRIPAESTDRETTPREIVTAANFPLDCADPGVTPRPPAETLLGSTVVQQCWSDTSGPESGSNTGASLGTQRAWRASSNRSSPSKGGAAQQVSENDQSTGGKGQQARPDVDDIARLKELDLRPSSFTSLEEAFHASLCVVRCLRGVLHLVHGAHGPHAHIGQQLGDCEATRRRYPDYLSFASDILAHQESFVADDVAYAALLRGTRIPQSLRHVHEPQVSNDKSKAERAITSLSPQVAAAEPGIGLRAGAPLNATDAAQVGPGKAAARSPEVPEPLPMPATTACRGLEYELSVCKALLLLQQLTPSSVATVDEAPTPPSPPPLPSPHFGQQRRYSPCHNPTCLQKSPTLNASELLGPSSRDSGVPSAVLDVLLRVRLLKGTQQLLRADFVRLLHQQQKHQHQLEQAVRSTVTRLGPPEPAARAAPLATLE